MNAVAERPLFIAQDKLTQWEGEGKVNVNGNILTLIAERRSYALVPAVRFLRVVGSDPDAHGLVGKVRNREQLKALHAEAMTGSVIVGDIAYEVQDGFVGTALAPPPSTSLRPSPVPPPRAPPPPVVRPPSAPSTPAIAASAPPSKTAPTIADALGGAPQKTAPSDAELLANFLLDNLAG